MRDYLTGDRKPCFSFRTWEDLHAAVVKGDPDLEALDLYLRSKSAHYRPAFLLG